MAEIKDVVEIKFEEAKKKVIAKYDEFVKEIEKVLNELFTKYTAKLGK